MKPRKILPGLWLLLASVSLLSCTSSSLNIEEQAKGLLDSLYKKNYANCARMTYMCQSKLSKFNNEPEFKQREMAIKICSDIKDDFFNEDKYTSIAYLFRFPCQYQMLEIKNTTIETSDGSSPIYRVFAKVNYNSMDQSPDAVPLLLKAEDINNNNYKVKEIIFHCDLDSNTGLYLGWGTDKHAPW